jgi:hypothetical protein
VSALEGTGISEVALWLTGDSAVEKDESGTVVVVADRAEVKNDSLSKVNVGGLTPGTAVELR